MTDALFSVLPFEKRPEENLNFMYKRGKNDNFSAANMIEHVLVDKLNSAILCTGVCVCVCEY